MTARLTIKDEADGTGATVAVTGGTSACVVQRAVQAAGSLGAYANAAGPYNVTGTDLVSGLDYYWWRLTDGGSTVLDGPYFQPSTIEGDSDFERCGVMLADRIAAIGLKDLPGGVVYLPETGGVGDQGSSAGVVYGTLPKINQYERPCIFIYSTGQMPEDRSEGTPLSTDDIGYPFAIEFVGEEQKDDWERLRARWKMYWVRIRNAIANQRWDGRVPELVNVTVRPGAESNESFLKNVVLARVGSMTALCVCREDRGLTLPHEP